MYNLTGMAHVRWNVDLSFLDSNEGEDFLLLTRGACLFSGSETERKRKEFAWQEDIYCLQQCNENYYRYGQWTFIGLGVEGNGAHHNNSLSVLDSHNS